ncbi:MAG: hypothetical protein AMXMBFR64_41290 [Myxococcales bacterium]
MARRCLAGVTGLAMALAWGCGDDAGASADAAAVAPPDVGEALDVAGEDSAADALAAVDGGSSADAVAPDTDLPDVGPRLTPDAVATPDAGPSFPEPPDLAARGWLEARSILHLHSAYSKDGCDDAGLDEQGNPNAACVARLRASICQERLDYVFLSDHPSHMKDHPFEALLYYDAAAGDELVAGPHGPWVNRLQCAGGHVARLFVGYEATHTMPLGLERHLEPLELTKTNISTDKGDDDLAAQQEAVAAAKAAGGAVFIAHTEEGNIPLERLLALPLDGMEIYNLHANFLTSFTVGFDRLLSLEPWLVEGAGVKPAADLALLAILDLYPEKALDKWRRVTAVRRATAIAGTDLHENVNLDNLCGPGATFQLLCEGLKADYPSLVALLEKGGPVILPDGERLDAYERGFRWMHNRLLVPDLTDEAAREALLEGRSLVIFTLLGDASVDLVASGVAVTEVGGEVPLGAVDALWVRLPGQPEPGAGATWTAADVAASPPALRAVLWRSTEEETTAVAEWTTFGETHALVPPGPGAYHLEVSLTPRHLSIVLPDAEILAEKEYRWIETNAIRVLP